MILRYKSKENKGKYLYEIKPCNQDGDKPIPKEIIAVKMSKT